MIAPAVPATRDVDDTTDHELVAAIRAGDDRAFECLYRRYQRRIASYIQGMVHDHARAEDITQDVFMSALRRMRGTDRPIAFKPWIYEIAKNACIDQFRRSRRAEEVSYDADEGLGSADYGRLVTKDPSPEVRYETKQQLDHLRGAFGGLSETHHEILVMRELEGLSYREIGERMGMTRPAVESTLFRARRRLTEEYEELVTGERCQRVQAIIAATGTAALGARDRRRVARHVSYCQPCLRQARLSGMDAADLVAKPLRAKIAALLPLPAFLKTRLAGSDQLALPHMANVSTWSAHVGAVDPGLLSGWGKAAATAATIAIAGVGAGVATNPPASVSAALGGGSISDRLGDGDGTAAPVAASGTTGPGAAGALGAPRLRGGGPAFVLPGEAADRGGSGGERDGDRPGAAGATGDGGTATGTVDAPAAPSAGATAPAAPDEATGLGDTLSRLGGTGGGSGDENGGDDGAQGPGTTGGAPIQQPAGPQITVPPVGPPSPGEQPPPADDPVKGAAEGVAKGADETAKGTGSATGTVTDGLEGSLTGE